MVAVSFWHPLGSRGPVHCGRFRRPRHLTNVNVIEPNLWLGNQLRAAACWLVSAGLIGDCGSKPQGPLTFRREGLPSAIADTYLG